MYNLEKQHSKGKLHAIERIEKLLDKNSFYEVGSSVSNYGSELGMEFATLPYDGVIAGSGLINGQPVYVYAQDFTVMGGTLGRQHGEKIAHVIELAIKSKCPVIGINDSGGARIQEGINSLAGYGDIFYYNTLASGYIPQISIIAGPCAGGAVYSPGITDFIFTIDGVSNMYVTGPKTIKSVTFETVTQEELGGAKVHAEKSGVSHILCYSEDECYKKVRHLLQLIPPCYQRQSSQYIGLYEEKKRNLISQILPERINQAYDVKQIIDELLDKDSFFELQGEFAKNIAIGFGKLSNITVGIVANQPAHLAGTLDCDASDKAARFVRYCDAYNIPIITLTDVPGFLPGVEQEFKGIIRHGAKLLYAYSEATTIKLNVILRKAYGGAYIAMCSKHLGADFVYAWPGSEISVMGAEVAIEVIYHKQLNALSEDEKKAFFNQKAEEYRKSCMSAKRALIEGYVDEEIKPEETRRRLFHDLRLLAEKESVLKLEKKHGNIPL